MTEPGDGDGVPRWASADESSDERPGGGFLGASDPGGVPRFAPPVPPRPSAAPPPPPAARPYGPGHGAGPGRHALPAGAPRGAARRGRRSELLLPLAGATALVVLAALGVYALAFRGGCSGDDAVTLNVAAAPELSPAITKAADRFNDGGHEVGDRCVRAEVAATDPAALATLLSGRGVASGVTRAPDVWIPDSAMWTAIARGSAAGARAVERSGTSLASSPIVVAVPRSAAPRGGPAPAWRTLLRSAASPGAPAAPSPLGQGRLRVPDPDRSAAGMASLLLANALLAGDPKRQEIFTGLVRTLRGDLATSVRAELAAFPGRSGRVPLALAPEQAVFDHNGRRPAVPAQAVYPAEGTLSLDYPYTLTTKDRVKAEAAARFRRELTGERGRDDVRDLGLRLPDGAAPESFGADKGVSAARPRTLPAPAAADVRRTLQAWARLTLGIRMLSVIDVSGSMNEEVAPGVTRLDSTLRAAQQGLSLLPDDTELGQWAFSTKLAGDRDWRELVSVGPLGQRFGSATRRRLVLSAFARLEAEKRGDTGLYDTVLAAFRHMKSTYKPEFVNSILLWTDGRNEDDDGPSLTATLDALRQEYDPNRPVQVIMFGYGDGVDPAELRRIAQVTRGDVYVAQTPADARRFLFKAVSRRLSR